jgi:hypothetical protein
MNYRVVNIEAGCHAEVGRFDSAYEAVDFIVAARSRGDRGAEQMGIVDFDDVLLFRPDHLRELGEGAA